MAAAEPLTAPFDADTAAVVAALEAMGFRKVRVTWGAARTVVRIAADRPTQRPCEYCEQPFPAKRQDARFCSPRCCHAAWRERGGPKVETRTRAKASRARERRAAV